MEISLCQLSKIFNITEWTVRNLVNLNQIPFRNDPAAPAFSLGEVNEWLQKGPALKCGEELYLERLQENWALRYPGQVAEIQALDRKINTPRLVKRFSLSAIPNKQYGFLYYVRYIDRGRLIPSKWNTHTNNRQAAEKFALDNRSSILSAYYAKHAPEGTLYSVLELYYKRDSPYLEKDLNRGRSLGTKTLRVYYRFITREFIPFLKANGIKTFTGIDPPVITNFQDYLLAKGIKPQSVNRYLGCVSAIFSQLSGTGKIAVNVFDRVKALKSGANTSAVRGCHEIDSMAGVFSKPWKDRTRYLLCLLINTTGMRNSEIERMRVRDIYRIEDCHFINIKQSKTENGIRSVPLHPFVYRHIAALIKEAGKQGEDYIFSLNGGPNQSTLYKACNITLGEKLKLTGEQLAKQGISFYSGRHFWKTLMNREDLGEDVEEYFMGHKVSSDVKKRYNHLDKRGKQHLLDKARQIFDILDKRLFQTGG
jgi:integrase